MTDFTRVSANLKEDVLDRPIDFRYRMLSRFKADADYFFRNTHVKFLWAGDPVEHANNMIAVYDSFSSDEKPEWLTKEELDGYVNRLKAIAEENGTED